MLFTMNNPDLDRVELDPITKLAIGVLGGLVALLGVAHGIAAFTRYHARAQR